MSAATRALFEQRASADRPTPPESPMPETNKKPEITLTNRDREAIATETLKYTQQGYYTDSKENQITLRNGQTLRDSSNVIKYRDLSQCNIDRAKYRSTFISVDPESPLRGVEISWRLEQCQSFSATPRSKQELADGVCNPVLINCTHFVLLGGGFRMGNDGEEQELCYCSELADLVNTVLNDRANSSPFPHEPTFDKVIHTPDVTFFRSRAGNIFHPKLPDYGLMDIPFRTSVIFSQAPMQPKLTTLPDGTMDYADEDTRERMRTSIMTQLYASYLQGHNTLVIGAFGCEPRFGNPPHAVAKLYKEVINTHFRNEHQQGAFKSINFQIPDKATQEIFRKVFYPSS